MRQLESEAYEKGNLIFRDWEDMSRTHMSVKPDDGDRCVIHMSSVIYVCEWRRACICYA